MFVKRVSNSYFALTLVSLMIFIRPTKLKADDFAKYFAAFDYQTNWAGDWEVRFVRTNPSYFYKIEEAGKNGANGLACNQISARSVQRIAWKDFKAEAGANGKVPSATFTADANVVDVFGGEIQRALHIPFTPYDTNEISSQTHFRVAVYDQSGRRVYRTIWYGGPDIMNWNWRGPCSWVKEK